MFEKRKSKAKLKIAVEKNIRQIKKLEEKKQLETSEKKLNKWDNTIKVLREENKKMAKLALGPNGLEKVKEVVSQPEQVVPQQPTQAVPQQVEQIIPQQVEQIVPQQPTQEEYMKEAELEHYAQIRQQQMEQQQMQQQQMQQIPQQHQQTKIQNPFDQAINRAIPRMQNVEQPQMNNIQHNIKQEVKEIMVMLVNGTPISIPIQVNELESFIIKINEVISNQEAMQLGNIFINGRNVLYYQI